MSEQGGYRVLARKYRPDTFADLVGQDAMVRTLRNAFEADRIAQAFIMTGIRGTGKTTTARIIAKGMNCTGTDGTGKPTTDPCGTCPQCVGIAAGTHVDVIEMDGASNTGVDNIRSNIIDNISYAPTSSRFKIYIIDEVHMLSTSAFNALLKTLEEPPAHVKFIFATTEIRKVPVTVLSRCQRFDLRRIEPEDMIALLRRIADAETAQIEDAALSLITRAAEGSARDATSLLDQAISHGAGETTADQVRAMLGLADRGRVLDLFDRIMRGDAAGALDELGAQYADGADPQSVLRDLAEIAHWLAVMKVTPDAADDPTLPHDTRVRGTEMASHLSQRVLGRAWQMLLKALDEVGTAPNPMMAAEMAVIRMTHVADLPSPEELMRKFGTAPSPSGTGAPAPSGPSGSGATARATAPQPVPAAAPRSFAPRSAGPALATQAAADSALDRFPNFDAVVALIRSQRDIKLLVEVESSLRLISYSPGRIAFEPGPLAPADLAQRLGARLQSWTGSRWAISVAATGGAPTITETRDAEMTALKQQAARHPLVAAVLLAFPGAQLSTIRTEAELNARAAAEALPEIPDADDADGNADDWDPFDDE
ncbi:DNA polymerase III subunit gamma/tau [Pseudoruegeria sp. SK021]|uniref:DNA polymerase III subunit gamma/tau n=1 Tax=Pseudoruegeria sp. SK021 TaxID=1933035 RepID=UPI000A25D25F|nr:DNA polymerase III subunit gamma/tau [Pseudoruegeria sp. SK021]